MLQSPKPEVDDQPEDVWSVHWDDSTGFNFYLNRVTGESQWEAPPHLAGEQAEGEQKRPALGTLEQLAAVRSNRLVKQELEAMVQEEVRFSGPLNRMIRACEHAEREAARLAAAKERAEADLKRLPELIEALTAGDALQELPARWTAKRDAESGHVLYEPVVGGGPAQWTKPDDFERVTKCGSAVEAIGNIASISARLSRLLVSRAVALPLARVALPSSSDASIGAAPPLRVAALEALAVLASEEANTLPMITEGVPRYMMHIMAEGKVGGAHHLAREHAAMAHRVLYNLDGLRRRLADLGVMALK
jgi:hypothetical protein